MTTLVHIISFLSALLSLHTSVKETRGQEKPSTRGYKGQPGRSHLQWLKTNEPANSGTAYGDKKAPIELVPWRPGGAAVVTFKRGKSPITVSGLGEGQQQ